MLSIRYKSFADCFRRSVSLIAVPCALIALQGCATTPTNPGSGTLDQWVDSQLAPYLANELSVNPRFSNGSFQLVKLDRQEIAPEIDELVDDIRARLFNTLVTTQGVDMAWRPSVRPWQHHRSLSQMDCGLRKQASHLIGVDIRRGASGLQRVDIRALDIAENEWVSGFGRSWTGNLSAAEETAFSRNTPDRYLRGLRPLPFTSDQADLTTSYLAHNLSCLLFEGAPERLTVYVKPPAEGQPRFFHTVSSVIGRYLNQFREVELVGDVASADAVIDSELLKISDDLWQVWMGVTYKDNERRVSGADTPAYVNLTPLDTQPIKPIIASPATVESPQEIYSSSASTDAVPAINSEPVEVSQEKRLQIHNFNALVPVSQSTCETTNPWFAGERALETGEQLRARDCFALEASIEAHSVFLITRSGEGEWFRLIGSSCQGGLYSQPYTIAKAGSLRVPQSGVFELTGKDKVEQFFLIAAESSPSAEAVESILQALPDQCASEQGAKNSPLAELASVAGRFKGGVVWREMAIAH